MNRLSANPVLGRSGGLNSDPIHKKGWMGVGTEL
jgi:hypothetical protein